MQIEAMLTPARAARELNITPARIRQLLASGRIPHIATPLGRLIAPETVREFAASRRHGAQGTRKERQ